MVDRRGRKKPLLLGLIPLASAALILCSTTTKVGQLFGIFAVTFIGISWAVRRTALRSLEADLVPKELRGRVSGILSFISGVAFAGGQLVAGPIYEYSPTIPFIISFVFIIVSILFALKIDDTQKHKLM
ncbi:MAG: MFS transporter [Candidatus Korarchaeota archaeon]|nr:MFS transporter [Candidatus Korarchaeota archaeon]NIU85114.1 MFS transporter [Candidatus Thorarchaeota archaeon]NIW15078.1 MFS transporter [Candidatus Thorarchaeota archaeon]NIW53088.1 MFS transporter [Candidatus Korarchaeota archaeon]